MGRYCQHCGAVLTELALADGRTRAQCGRCGEIAWRNPAPVGMALIAHEGGLVLIRRLAVDHNLPRGVRIRLHLLLAYLIVPIDLIPDFLPVIGYADDAIIVAVALRSVMRRSGPQALESHWPGSAAGLETIRYLAGIRPEPDA